MSLRVFVAGHNGMVGSSIIKHLQESSDCTIITADRSELDLLDQIKVREFLHREKPDQIYMAAARVGGIHANNSLPAQFIYENLMVEANVIHEAWSAGIKKLLFLGSSCIYPKLANQPMPESTLLSGHLEPTNEPYAIAKIAGIKLCESYNRQYGVDFRSVMPTNLYGPGDNYHPTNSHVIPALIHRIHNAMINNVGEVAIWGSGNPRREFLFVDDMAAACVLVMNKNLEDYQKYIKPMESHVNVGSGTDITIKELADAIVKCIGYKGKIIFDSSKPDGSPQKLMDSSKLIQMGWNPTYDLHQGLKIAYEDYCNQKIKKYKEYK